MPPNRRYYFDTSIWLDFLENRDEPHLPKGEWAHKLLNKLTKDDDKVIFSDNNIYELNLLGYPLYELGRIFRPLKPILLFVESTEKQNKKARDLSSKRDVPQRDALHALIARDNRSILVTLDRHFQKLRDITPPNRPQDLI